MPAALRLIHPAPALAVVILSAALGLTLAAQAGEAIGSRLALVLISVAGSQIATGAFNDFADRRRDAGVRPEKPIPAGGISPTGALLVGTAGVSLQLASSAALGVVPLLLGSIAVTSALAYNFVLSRTPFSILPYILSFGVLPAWIASGIGVPLERVLPASMLAAPFAAAAHLANTLRDFDTDAAGGSRSLAQVLGRRVARGLALGLALGVGIGVAIAFALDERLHPASLMLGASGLAAVTAGASGERRLWLGMLIAAVCWTAAWAMASG